MTFFLKLQEFLDKDSCHKFLSSSDEKDKFRIGRVLIQVWPDLLNEISLINFVEHHKGVSIDNYQFIAF